MATVAERIAEWLDEKRIETVFGIVGGGNTALFEAIAARKKTRIICQHHEQACVMAAGAYSRIAHRIGVALVTTGAGSTNAVTGVVAGWMDSTPLVVLSGNEAAKYMYAPTRVWGVQGFDSCEMVKSCTKGAFRPEGMHDLDLDGAVALAMRPRQGPVWIDLPKSVQNARI